MAAVMAPPKAQAFTTAKEAPVTARYAPATDLDKNIARPELPRAYEAVTPDHPEGSVSGKKQMSVMQQHVEFFDRNKDGVIMPWETFVGFRAIGFNILFCLTAMFIIHSGFSYPSSDSWIPDPRLPIHIKNIHRCKHGSDSEVYDTEGRFTPQKYSDILSKFDRNNKGGLTWSEIWEMQRHNRNVNDFFGQFAAFFEWGTLYLLIQRGGVVHKDDIRTVFDGTLFYNLEQQRKKGH